MIYSPVPILLPPSGRCCKRPKEIFQATECVMRINRRELLKNAGLASGALLAGGACRAWSQQGSRGQPGVLQQLAAIDSHDALRGLKDLFRAFAAAPRGREKDGDWRINHPDKLTIGCKPEMKFWGIKRKCRVGILP